jgi:1-acyl-sn-glycerol-3-phosphate acyltransferase
MSFVIFVVQFLLHLFLKPIFKYFLHYRVIYLLPKSRLKKQYVICANHSCELDPFLIACAMPLSKLPMFTVTVRRQYYQRFGWKSIFMGGFLFKLIGGVPIIKHQQNYQIALGSHLKILKKGYSVLIFPEGKVNTGVNHGVAHGGCAYLASKSRLPVLPVHISGTNGLSFSDLLFRRRKVSLIIGKPIKAIIPDTNKVPLIQKSAKNILLSIYSLK